MHAFGVHSALAIKRQRKRREEQRKREKERRFSSESGLGDSPSTCGSPRGSICSGDVRPKERRSRMQRMTPDNIDGKVVSSIGMLHIGVVFLVLGAFLVGAGLIPDDWEDWGHPPGGKWINELVVTGGFALGIGVFLIVLNKIIVKQEEDDLTEYVQRQLTRSKSGHRLVRDVETGCLTTKREFRARRNEETLAKLQAEAELLPPVHCSPTLKSPPPLTASTPRSDLERILEEELSEKGEEECRAMDRFNKEMLMNGRSENCRDPRELLTTRFYNNLQM